MTAIGVLHAVLDPSEAQVQIAVISAAGTILVTLLSVWGARKAIHPKTPKNDPDANMPPNPSLLSAYSGEQNEFIRLVIADSKTLHAKVDKMEGIVEALKKDRQIFIGAVARYITKLANAWGSGGKMPYPDTEDMSLLEETLPADWRRRNKIT
jgi:hypothetical protein